MTSTKKRILIIEDDAIVGAVYKGLLSNRGYEPHVETTGRGGLEQISTFAPDAVLLDLMLPETNGLEVLKTIRNRKDAAGLPVLVFTNAYVPAMLEGAKNLGANFIFSKSTLTSRQLLEALHQCVPGAPECMAGGYTGREIAALPASAGSSNVIPMPIPAPNRRAGESAATEFLVRPSTPPSSPVVESTESGSRSGAPPMDAQTQEVRSEFIKTIGPNVAQLRYTLSELSKSGSEAAQAKQLEGLHRQVRTFGSAAGFAGFRPSADICSAFELLIAELVAKPRMFNPSVLRTMVNTLDVLNDLVIRRVEVDLLYQPPPSILVVDDEILSRRAVTFALEKGRLRAQEFEDPREALQATQRTQFDLIFLDVQMPHMDGFELCTQLRAQLTNQKTPVIFVTSMSDFKSRVRSTISGATDLIAKPFLFFELTVKAVSTLVQVRSQKADRPLLAA